MIRRTMLAMSRNEWIKDASMATPVTRDLVRRFVAGEQASQAVAVAGDLAADGLTVTIDRLGEDVCDVAGAQRTVSDYVDLLSALQVADLTTEVEVSVKLSAVGQALPRDGEAIALEGAYAICRKAAEVGTTVTLDMEDHTTVDSTLAVLGALRTEFPWVGAVLQAYLFRTEGDCRDLAHSGSRVRLCKGAYAEPESVAFGRAHDVDLAYVRCMKILAEGGGYPMFATHDPRLIEIGQALVARAGRERGTYEFQMLQGVRPDEQRRLARAGETVRVYLPYGEDWYGYMVRRMAEKPANLALFLRSLASGG